MTTEEEKKVTELTIEAMRTPFEHAQTQMDEMLKKFSEQGTKIASEYQALAAEVTEAVNRMGGNLAKDVEEFKQVVGQRTEDLAHRMKTHMDSVAAASAEVRSHGQKIASLNGGFGGTGHGETYDKTLNFQILPNPKPNPLGQ